MLFVAPFLFFFFFLHVCNAVDPINVDLSNAKTSSNRAPSHALHKPTDALFQAINKGDIVAARRAISEGAMINENGDEYQKGNKQTPLMMASLYGEAEIAALLLEKGADPTIGEKQGYTPLHGAAFQGRFGAASVLLKANNVPFDFHEDGFHPIHRACWGTGGEHFGKTVKLFIEHGVSPRLLTRSRGEKPMTPLQLATRAGNKYTIQVIKDALEDLDADEDEPQYVDEGESESEPDL